LKVIHKIADELELEINKAVSNKDLFHMFKLEKSLVYYLNAINSNNKVIEKLKTNATKIGFSQEVNELLEDVIIENTQCYAQANTYSEVLSSMMDAWASIINNNLNIRIKTLTILSLCIMTPTLIVSLFSMNVVMPFTHEQGLMPFYLIITIALFAVLGIFLISRYRKW
jgi:magnesium transporter